MHGEREMVRSSLGATKITTAPAAPTAAVAATVRFGWQLVEAREEWDEK